MRRDATTSIVHGRRPDDRCAVTGRRASTMHRKNATQPRQIQRTMLACSRLLGSRQHQLSCWSKDRFLSPPPPRQAGQFYLTPHVCTEVQRWLSSSVDMPLSVCVRRLDSLPYNEHAIDSPYFVRWLQIARATRDAFQVNFFSRRIRWSDNRKLLVCGPRDPDAAPGRPPRIFLLAITISPLKTR